ncbi:MAG: nucleotidyltransferase domain-containing protein [Desulfurococcales archaeon]|nr:nucleotidyltransferase domain-containing protein [Desulfurococcales archaeon]
MEELREIVEKLRRSLNLAAVVLFESRARGDYDLLVITWFRESYLDRIKLVLDILADVKIPVEPHPYTPQEALEMLRKGSPTIVDALEEGIVLYDSGWLKALRDELKRIKKRGLRRSKTTIILPRRAEEGEGRTSS